MFYVSMAYAFTTTYRLTLEQCSIQLLTIIQSFYSYAHVSVWMCANTHVQMLVEARREYHIP